MNYDQLTTEELRRRLNYFQERGWSAHVEEARAELDDRTSGDITELVNKAGSDEEAHEQLVDRLYNHCKTIESLNQRGEGETADNLHDITERILAESPNSVHDRLIEVEKERDQ